MCNVNHSIFGAIIMASSLITAQPMWAGDLRLVMVEQSGCAHCAQWNRDIAPIWPKTDEGRDAPLRRVDLHTPLPDDLTLNAKIVFTPTFVLTDNGTEVARLEGYPGEDFFWPIIGGMIKTAQTNSTDHATPAKDHDNDD